MKSNKGITLMSLVVYVIVLILVLGIISNIVSVFYNNIGQIQADTDEIIQLSHFNTYFLKEVKQIGNHIDTIGSNYILFSSGNSFSIADNQIYYNNVVICTDVESLTFEAQKNENNEYQDVIRIGINFEHLKKSLTYKLEEIY